MACGRSALGVVVAVGGTAALLPAAVGWLRRRGVLDVPTARSLHDEPVPRGGGLAPVVCLLAALLVVGPMGGRDLSTFLLVVGGLGALGLTDDVLGLPAVPRLIGQTAAAVLAVAGLGVLSSEGLVLGALGALWVVAFVNAFNFMDGVNGLAATQAIVAGTAWWLMGWHVGATEVQWTGLLLVAVAVGFLPFNFPKASVFLGDVGSYGLGGAAAVLVVIGVREDVPVVAMVAPLALVIADTGTTLLRRVWRREPVLVAHRDHVFQQLAAEGWGHLRITTTMAGLAVLAAGAGALSIEGTWAALGGGIGVLVVAATYLALPAVVSRSALPGGSQPG